MAPERFNTGQSAPSSDIYALACVLYQCLTGELPFPGDTLEQVAVSHMVMPPPRPSQDRATVPQAMDQVIATGLAKQPTDRYPSAVQMAAAARQALTKPNMRPQAIRPAPTQPWQSSSVAPPIPMRPGRHPRVLIGALAGIALLTAGGVR
jgi:serine/threonine-protein kinase